MVASRRYAGHIISIPSEVKDFIQNITHQGSFAAIRYLRIVPAFFQTFSVYDIIIVFIDYSVKDMCRFLLGVFSI